MMTCFFVWAFLFALQAGVPPGMPFTTLEQGVSSNIENPRQLVVRTPAEWQSLWRAHEPERTAPTVNLANTTVTAVFLGTRPTGGYRVEIVAVRRDGETLIVEYAERGPGPGNFTAQALTSPFHIVTIPRHDGPIRFEQRPAAR